MRARSLGKRLGLALAALLVPAGALCQTGSDDPPSNEGALFLLLPVGAKAVSLARAMTAMDGPESVFWNPAGLGGLAGSQVVLVRGEHFAGQATAASGLLSRPGVGALGLTYFLLDAGEQDVTDIDGNYLGTLTVRNHLGVASAAAEVSPALSMGLSFKFIQFRRSCRGLCPDEGTTATTYALDAGFLARPNEGLRVGGMIAHVGPRYQILNVEQADPLPWRMRLAVAYDVLGAALDREALGGWLTIEIQDRILDPGRESVFLGAELTAGATDALFLRAGYGIAEFDQDDGASVGLGLRFQGIDLGIAKSLSVSSLTGESEPIHVTLSYVF